MIEQILLRSQRIWHASQKFDIAKSLAQVEEIYMAVRLKRPDSAVDADSTLVINIDGFWYVDDFVKLFSGLMFSNRLFSFCLQISDWPPLPMDPLQRQEFIEALLEGHFKIGEPKVLSLPLGKAELTVDISLASPYVESIRYSSPGKITLIGASGIFKEIRKMYEFNSLKEELRRKSAAEALKAEEEATAQRIKNVAATVAILKKLNFSDEELRTIVGYSKDWISVFKDFTEVGKITKIETPNEKEKDDGDGGLETV
jgi:hypothetical protein